MLATETSYRWDKDDNSLVDSFPCSVILTKTFSPVLSCQATPPPTPDHPSIYPKERERNESLHEEKASWGNMIVTNTKVYYA